MSNKSWAEDQKKFGIVVPFLANLFELLTSLDSLINESSRNSKASWQTAIGKKGFVSFESGSLGSRNYFKPIIMHKYAISIIMV